MNIIEDIRVSFRTGILGASTVKSRILRWSGLIALWTLALGSWTLGTIASVQGYGLQGASIIVSGFTFVIVSGSVIFTSATSELVKKW